MRLDPVYLVEPESPAAASRRAFLCMGGTFLLGAGLGGVCGYAGTSSLRAQSSDEPSAGNARDPLLADLRRLARDGTEDELLLARFRLPHFVSAHYPHDGVLWGGIERLSQIVLARADCPDRLVLARDLANLIEQLEPPQLVADLSSQLQRIH
jgi:hypothetical protein